MLTRHGPVSFDMYFTSLLTLIHLSNIYALLIYKYSLIIHVSIVYLHMCSNQLNSMWSMASAIL